MFFVLAQEAGMARQTHPTNDTPKRTPSLVCEVPLRVTPAQERTLLVRLEAARQVYNACLGEACKRGRLGRESKAFQRARTLPRDDPARKALFAQARTQQGCSEYALHAYAQQFGHAWLGAHLDSLTIQTLASRAYGAANRLALGRARRVRFKGRHQRHLLVRRWGGMEGAGALGAPGSALPGAGGRTLLSGQVPALGPSPCGSGPPLL